MGSVSVVGSVSVSVISTYILVKEHEVLSMSLAGIGLGAMQSIVSGTV